VTVTTGVDGSDRGGEDRALAILQAVTFAAERIMRLPVDEGIDDLLARLGQATGATRVALVRAKRRADEAVSRMDVRSQWTDTGIAPLRPPDGGYPYFPRWERELRAGRLVVGDVASFPDDERGPLQGDAVRSIVITPVVVDGAWFGHLGLDDTRHARTWTEGETDALRAAAAMLGAGIAHDRTEETMRRRTAILDAVGLATPRLLGARQWQDALPDVLGLLLDATGSRSAWAYGPAEDGDRRDGILLAERTADGALPSNDPGRVIRTAPGILERLSAGEVLQNEFVTEDPEWEARALAVLGVRTWVMAPINTTDGSWGVLGLDSLEDRAWTEGEVAALTVAAETLAAAVVRERVDRTLKIAEEQVRRAEKMEAVGRLASGTAHDFNNLLTAIVGHASLLHDAATDPETLEDAQAILDAAGRGAELVRDLLALSRRRPEDLRVVDLEVLLRRIVRMSRGLLRRDVDVDLVIDPTAIRARADPSLLEDALVNLVVNANDAMPAGGRLTLATGPDINDSSLVLRVTDTGDGMEPAVLDRIFEPFFTTKGEGQGTGLGLPTVYAAVTQAGGRVDVASEPGHGTTFLLHLPRANAEAA
jgi:signal transduction histidine kinase